MTLHRCAAAAAAALLASAAAPALALAQDHAAHAAHAAHRAPTVAKSVKVEPGGLYEIVFNPADRTLLVAGVGPRGETRGAVTQLSAELEPLRSYDVSANPFFGLGLNSRTQILYGTATRSGTVDALDLKTGRIVGHVEVPEGESSHVRQVVVDEQRNKAYVTIVGAEVGDDSRANQVWVIDGTSHALERKIDVAVGVLTGAALDVAANRLFVVGMMSGEAAAIDLASGETVGRWPTESEWPTNVALDPKGGRLFVASQRTGDLTVMNAADGAILRKVPTGEGALSVAYDAVLDRIYVANRQAGTVSVVNGADYALLADLKTGTYPQTIAIDPQTHAVYVSNKALSLPRDAAPGTPPPNDPAGDTVTLIRP